MEDSEMPSRWWRGLVLPLSLSIAAHGMIVALLAWLLTARLPSEEAMPLMLADFVQLPEEEPPGPAELVQTRDSAAHNDISPVSQRDQPTPTVETKVLPPTINMADVLTDAQLAGILGEQENAGGRNAGGACDMVHALQSALRRDPQVQMAVEGAARAGKILMLWNGDWVRAGEQDGKGLSVAREVIMWELAFAPKPCQHQIQHGPVVLSLDDGKTRFVIGTQNWHWVDLLGLGNPSPAP